MGSSGSYFLGWALAALGIIVGAKVATVLLVMGLPILDVAWLMVNRWRRGGSHGMGVGGRDHLHHRLLDRGFTPRQIVLGYYAFCLAFGAAALGLENRLYKVAALLVLTGLALAVLIWAGRGAGSSRGHQVEPAGAASDLCCFGVKFQSKCVHNFQYRGKLRVACI